MIAVMCDVHHGDCLAVLRTLPDESVDAVVTDPPYGLSNTDPKHVAETLTKWVTGDHEYTPPAKGGFMGKTWDSFVPPPAVWVECMRVLKPGGHLLVFAGTRTQDLMGLSIRLAGFEIRDSLAWIYGSGMPKSMDVSKAIDKRAGAEREVIGANETLRKYMPNGSTGSVQLGGCQSVEELEHLAEIGGKTPGGEDARKVLARRNDHEARFTITAPATPEAERWAGWGTALKPSHEPVLCARKPLTGTVAGNVLEWGTGALNIDASRVATDDDTARPNGVTAIWQEGGTAKAGIGGGSPAGRWPANVLLDPEAAAAMDQQSGASTSRSGKRNAPKVAGTFGAYAGDDPDRMGHSDQGGASRFFPVFKYQAKAPKKERPVIEREDGTKIQHPTVKPEKLMEWLVTLVTPPGGVVLDPFAGSGTTLQAARDKGFRSIGIEADADHVALIRERLEQGSGEPDLFTCGSDG